MIFYVHIFVQSELVQLICFLWYIYQAPLLWSNHAEHLTFVNRRPRCRPRRRPYHRPRCRTRHRPRHRPRHRRRRRPRVGDGGEILLAVSG